MDVKHENFREREFEVEHMLTVEKLIGHLKQFNPKALVCTLEVNTGDWQAQSLDNLNWLVRTASEEREELKKNPKMFHKGKMEEEIEDMLKYVHDEDVLIRF